MDQKSCFNELMKQRHSSRYFQSKEIPEEILKQIISTSLKLLHGAMLNLGIYMLLQAILYLKSEKPGFQKIPKK